MLAKRPFPRSIQLPNWLGWWFHDDRRHEYHEIHGFQGNHWFSMKINENQWFLVILRASLEVKFRPRGCKISKISKKYNFWKEQEIVCTSLRILIFPLFGTEISILRPKSRFWAIRSDSERFWVILSTHHSSLSFPCSKVGKKSWKIEKLKIFPKMLPKLSDFI